MKISVIGAGYVGLVTAAGLSKIGHTVVCQDIDKEKIAELKKGQMPIYEEGLEEIIKDEMKKGRIEFTLDCKEAIDKSEIIFIAVGTPPLDSGETDLRYIESVSKEIGGKTKADKTIVIKSTVPVGTSKKVKEWLGEKNKFEVVNNPEFLREGTAIKDFLEPDRIVIGGSEKACSLLKEVYAPIDCPVLCTDNESAEIIKYASNSFLATKISFINLVSRLCEKTSANIKDVAKGVGMDSRIGSKFLMAGLGYGGSCFPKDVDSFIYTAREKGLDFGLFEETHKINKEQRIMFFEKIKKELGDLNGKKIAVLGLAFKPNTDDMREAPSIDILKMLRKEKAEIHAYDPIAEENAKKSIDGLKTYPNIYETMDNADVLVILTDWAEFREMDFSKIKKLLKNPLIIDGRNMFEKIEGFRYVSIGRKTKE